MSETPVVIEVALNGGSTKRRNPNVPRTPDEIISDTYSCLDAVSYTHLTLPTS